MLIEAERLNFRSGLEHLCIARPSGFSFWWRQPTYEPVTRSVRHESSRDTELDSQHPEILW